MNLNDWAHEVHETAVCNGWWTDSYNDGIPTKLLMIHSEVSECVDNYRHGLPLDEELVDVIIRALDLCAKLEVNVEAIVQAKNTKNKSRGFRHGGRII